MKLIENFETKSKFFNLETCNRYQTIANFKFYHVVKFQVSRICTFSAINDIRFCFHCVKSHFWVLPKKTYTPYDPQI